jgi:prophage DNA circulation protein
MTVFEKYVVASWQVGNYPALRFPVLSISEGGGNRIVERERPYRDGVKLDDTGSKGKTWSVRVCFENSIVEEGLDQSTQLYPDILNQLIASFDFHEPGELILPTRGFIAARAVDYQREETFDDRDSATVTFTWKEDNQDDVGNLQFEQYNANASARRLGQQTFFSASSEGVWSSSLVDLQTSASQLEAYANYPDDTMADIDTQSAIVIGASNRVIRAFSHQNDTRRNRLGDPELSTTQRQLEATKDMAGRARAQAYRGRPRQVPFVPKGTTNIFAIAAMLRQKPEDLLAINPSIDPLYIAGGSVVNVLEKR